MTIPIFLTIENLVLKPGADSGFVGPEAYKMGGGGY